jgi:nickel-dependent lactate racemase
MCNKFETNTRFLEYVDDVNILIYEKSIEKNCRNLERMHKLCERWTIRHKFVFVSIKYELIHFIKNSKKFDMTITSKIDSNTIQSRINIRVLDVQIDTRLKWDSHVRKIQEKMTKQIMILTKLSIFI